jgi:RNA polymerase subunit RPABC4/transcription elongation factor Spt4
METQTCENCEAVISTTETKCPKCGVVFEDLNDAIATVERAQTIIEKRKAKAAPPAPAPTPTPTPQPAPVAEKRNPFTSLGKVIRNK